MGDRFRSMNGLKTSSYSFESSSVSLYSLFRGQIPIDQTEANFRPLHRVGSSMTHHLPGWGFDIETLERFLKFSGDCISILIIFNIKWHNI